MSASKRAREQAREQAREHTRHVNPSVQVDRLDQVDCIHQVDYVHHVDHVDHVDSVERRRGHRNGRIHARCARAVVSPARIALAYVYATGRKKDEFALAVWPDEAQDAIRERRLLDGFNPSDLVFSPASWATLTPERRER